MNNTEGRWNIESYRCLLEYVVKHVKLVDTPYMHKDIGAIYCTCNRQILVTLKSSSYFYICSTLWEDGGGT